MTVVGVGGMDEVVQRFRVVRVQVWAAPHNPLLRREAERDLMGVPHLCKDEGGSGEVGDGERDIAQTSAVKEIMDEGLGLGLGLGLG